MMHTATETTACPYCHQPTMPRSTSSMFPTCPRCLRLCGNLQALPWVKERRWILADSVLRPLGGVTLLAVVTCFLAGTIAPTSLIRGIGTYLLVMGSIDIIDAFAAWRSGVFKTRLPLFLSRGSHINYAAFHLSWGAATVAIGIHGLIIAAS